LTWGIRQEIAVSIVGELIRVRAGRYSQR